MFSDERWQSRQLAITIHPLIAPCEMQQIAKGLVHLIFFVPLWIGLTIWKAILSQPPCTVQENHVASSSFL